MSGQVRQRGVVLIVVLWIVAMLTVLLAAFVATVKVERQTVADVVLSVQARAAMDAVLEYLAAVQLAAPEALADMPGQRFELLLNEQVVAFRIVPEDAFIPLNGLDEPVLATVLAGMGLPGADSLAQRLVALRTEVVDDNGVTPAVFPGSLLQLAGLLDVDVEQLRPFAPWLSFFGRHTQVTAGHVPEAMLAQLGLLAGEGGVAQQFRVQVEVVADWRPRQVDAIAAFADGSYQLLHINEYNVDFSLNEP